MTVVRESHKVLEQLRQQYPNTPFLALGQTVFWDEPMKASLRLLLDEYELGGEMVVGVHDTDYFAKAQIQRKEGARFALMPHNDGTTKDLWSAAGEISTLFGSETFPSRHHFAQAGVVFDRAAATSPLSYAEFLDSVTEAWGWRGVVYTGSRDLVVNSLSLKEVGDAILEMLQWGFENAITQIAPSCCHHEAEQIAESVLERCREIITSSPEASLSDLFQQVLPTLYELLLDRSPNHLTVTCTTEILRFTPKTATLPRFQFVDLFLNPETREVATQAYNHAVSDSEIYTLDKFGAGALPFDVIVPGRGRGTLRLHPRVLFIETRQPIPIALKKPITSVQELAEVLHARFGEDVTLVGKAVSLVSMLSREFLFVFHEEGSMYVWRTRKMNDYLKAHGIDLPVHPIVRLRYETWDALSVATSTLRLPEHLASTFGRATITAPEFASQWKQVIEEQKAFCAQSLVLKKPLELLAYLNTREPLEGWEERRARYVEAQRTLLGIAQERQKIQERVQTHYQRLHTLKQEHLALQQAKGEHFRSVEEWTPEAQERRQAFEAREVALMQEKAQIRRQVLHLGNERSHLERGEVAQQARGIQEYIENEAELARLRLVRNALLTIEGLPHTAHRPSAWWLPMVDASGNWFREIATTSSVYLEPLRSS